MGKVGTKEREEQRVIKWNVLQLRGQAGAENMAAFQEHHSAIPLIRPFITIKGIKAQLAAVAAALLAKD